VIKDGDSNAASQVPLSDASSAADLVPAAHETIASRVDAPTSNSDNSTPMLDVHAPHESIHTGKDFLIHIATICVGLLIAVALEQTVEAVHHRHQREQLLVSLDHDTRATLRDTDFIIDEYHRRIQWNRTRIGQVQAAPDEGALITIPADPAWEAARASGMIPLFSQGEIAAYSEVADVIGRARPRFDMERDADSKRRAFEQRYESVSGDMAANYRLDSPADLQVYLDLLLADERALEGSRFMAAVIRGAEAAILEGARDHDRIEDREMATLKSLPK
jgi:hypothetical protein